MFNIKHEYFRNLFSFHPLLLNRISSTIILESLSAFKTQILTFIRPSPNSKLNEHNPYGIKLLASLQVGLSHLREQKIRREIQDSLDPFCNCGRHIETLFFPLLKLF